MKHILILLAMCLANATFSQTATPFDQPPAWAKTAVWYQIFVERFHNGNPTNDPTKESIAIPPIQQIPAPNWKITPWKSDWFQGKIWQANGKTRDYDVSQRRYGGDLQGVLQKLDYLQELGVNALYFNPLNHAPSLHKYDASCYHHIDAHFGPDPIGDLRKMAAEDPNDPATWQWTAADELLLQIVKEAHKRGMKVILDYSWNHTGTLFWAWQDILKKQSKSAYKDWYEIEKFADTDGTFSYKGWLNISSLPEFKKVNVVGEKKPGFPYSGNLPEGVKAHIFAVTERWLAPNGKPHLGVDGFRLDVADHIGLDFWREFRQKVRGIKPDAYLVGEIWWEEWPDKLMNPAPYTQGDIFDAVMFYQAYRPARYFFAQTEQPLSAEKFRAALEGEWGRLRKENLQAMMNVASSHDTPRLLTDFENPNKYKYQVNRRDNPQYRTGKPTKESYQRLRLYLLHQFTTQGAPHIWNGEEMGMWGADDPECRKPLWWRELKFSRETNQLTGKKQRIAFNPTHFDYYRQLIALRKQYRALSEGEFEFVQASDKILVYKRFIPNKPQESVYICFNLDNQKQAMTLPETQAIFKDALTGKQLKRRTFMLPPLTARVLVPVE